jgi:predicted nucleic acid-binding protein
MAVVIDASVGIKWSIEEDASDLARELARRESLIVPDLFYVECANVLATHVRRGRLDASRAERAMTGIEAVPMRSIGARLHAHTAQKIAMELSQSAYDSLYLAVALAEGAIFVTADLVVAKAAAAHAIYAPWVSTLADFAAR